MSAPHVEITKLARLLGVDESRIAYLADVPPADLRRVREQATDVLFDGGNGLFERIAAASRLVPASVSATVAQKALGPLLCARITGTLDPDRAVEVAARLPVSFQADVAAELDPRRVGPVLTRLPADQVVKVGAELARRGDHITMGRFVGALPAGVLQALVRALDAESLLRTALYTEEEGRVGDVFAMIPDSRMAEVGAALSADEQLATDLEPVLDHLSPADRARLDAATT